MRVYVNRREPYSENMLDRAAEAFDPPGSRGNEPGVRFLRADVTDLAAYQGPFDAVVFNSTLAAQASPADALRRATLLMRPGARIVVSERAPEAEEEEQPAAGAGAAGALDVAAIAGALPLEAGAGAKHGKVMDATAAPSAAAIAEDSTGGALWVFEVPPLYSLRDSVTLAAPVARAYTRGSLLSLT